MIKEFKKFISRGNVLDLAVGVIVGSAFSAIITSLVNNIFTPIMGLILGGIDFSALSFQFRDTIISYGLFIQSVVNFLIIAFCVFIIIKAVNKITQKEEEKPKPAKTKELETLEEIRDLLKNKE